MPMCKWIFCVSIRQYEIYGLRHKRRTMVLGKGGSLHHSMVSSFWCYNNGDYKDANMGNISQSPTSFLEPSSFKRHWKFIWENSKDGSRNNGKMYVYIFLHLYGDIPNQRHTKLHPSKSSRFQADTMSRLWKNCI